MTRLAQSARVMSHVRQSRRHAPRACGASTCRQVVAPGRVFCPNHWFFLPDWMRDAIAVTFRDAEWDLHQDAIVQAADYIDAAFVQAREAGFDGLQSVRQPNGTRIAYMAKVIS